VDDVSSGCMSTEEGKFFFNKIMPLMLRAGFLLRKWTTNDQELQRYFDSKSSPVLIENCDEQTFSESQFGGTKISATSKRVLGVVWDVPTDEFVFKFYFFN